MKQLTLIRHAKSSWDDEQMADHERPLAKRGRRDLPLMACHFLGLNDGFGRVLVSPALRAKETLAGLQANGVFAGVPVSACEHCYTFDAEALAAVIRSQADADDALTVIGHNPAIHELVSTWYDPGVPRMPTCSLVRLRSDAASWADFTAGTVTLSAYLYPGMFRP